MTLARNGRLSNQLAVKFGAGTSGPSPCSSCRWRRSEGRWGQDQLHPKEGGEGVGKFSAHARKVVTAVRAAAAVEADPMSSQ